MSDLDNAIKSINESAVKAENTAGFLDDMSTFDDQSSVTNPNNGQVVASIPKQVKDRTDVLFAGAESEINQAVSDAAQSATDAQEAADSIGRYQGLWPDTGGGALKGDTYQTQVGGAETGRYFKALKDTSASPVGDDVNWREIVSVDSFSKYTDIVYKASGGNSAIDNMIINAGVGENCLCENGSEFKRKSSNGSIDDFTPISDLNIVDYMVTSSDFTDAMNKAASDFRGNPTWSTRLISSSDVQIDGDVNLRECDFDFSNIKITPAASTGRIVIGNKSTSSSAPNQTLGNVIRDGETINSNDITNPAVIVKGAKGGIYQFGEISTLQVYSDTNSASSGDDTSNAYSRFIINHVYSMNLTTAPTTDGSLIQWINENKFEIVRITNLLIDGTYNHNHNVFSGSFEGVAKLKLESGQSNVFKNLRLESVAGSGVECSAQTWNNSFEKSYATFWGEGLQDGVATPYSDSGRGNMLHKPSDYKLRCVDILSITRGTAKTFERGNAPVTTVKSFYAGVGDSDSYYINGAFRNFYFSDMIPVQKGEFFLVNADGGSVFRHRWYFYDADGAPVDVNLTVNVDASGNTAAVSGNSVGQGTNQQNSYIIILDDEIKYIRVSSSSGSGVSPFYMDWYTITAKSSFQNNRKWSHNSLISSQPAATDSSPAFGFASIGQVVESKSDSSYYKCVFSLMTTTVSGSGTSLVVDDGSGVSAGDIIGVKLSGSTHWTTVSSASGSNITLALQMPSNPIIGGTVTFNDWITVNN
ncbi:hypothetical protein VP511E551_P0071 [Vibrio phage 511E55-1]|nr:hypothetical protein VP511E551_P0071 [Vibrio phage 511E55-1]